MSEFLAYVGLTLSVLGWVAAALFCMAWGTLFPALGLAWLFGWLA